MLYFLSIFVFVLAGVALLVAIIFGAIALWPRRKKSTTNPVVKMTSAPTPPSGVAVVRLVDSSSHRRGHEPRGHPVNEHNMMPVQFAAEDSIVSISDTEVEEAVGRLADFLCEGLPSLKLDREELLRRLLRWKKNWVKPVLKGPYVFEEKEQQHRVCSLVELVVLIVQSFVTQTPSAVLEASCLLADLGFTPIFRAFWGDDELPGFITDTLEAKKFEDQIRDRQYALNRISARTRIGLAVSLQTAREMFT